MLTSFLALYCTALSQGPAPQTAPPKPSAIISKMIERYSTAKTITGTIKLRQGVKDAAPGSVVTILQFDKPSKLYIQQTLRASEGGSWLIVSDGKRFSYDAPELPFVRKGQRLVEPLAQPGAEPLDIRGVYSVAGQTLEDRSAPLDIALGRLQDLQLFTSQLVTLEYLGKAKIGEQEVTVIGGGWRPYNTAPPAEPMPASGRFEIYISDAGDLKRYIVRQMVGRPDGTNPFEVTSQWEVDLTVNGTPDPSLFKVAL